MQPLPRSFYAVVAPLTAAVLAGVTVVMAQPAPRLDVPYVPTPQEVVDRMLQLGKIRAGEFHMDLGSGDGRIAVTSASKHGARSFGVDLNPVRIEEARANAKKANVSDRATFELKNLFETDIGRADLVTMYLLPSVNIELRPKVLRDMWPGTRIVSHAFDMGDWTRRSPRKRHRPHGLSVDRPGAGRRPLDRRRLAPVHRDPPAEVSGDRRHGRDRRQVGPTRGMPRRRAGPASPST